MFSMASQTYEQVPGLRNSHVRPTVSIMFNRDCGWSACRACQPWLGGCVQEMKYIEALSPYHYRIQQGFVPHMRVPGKQPAACPSCKWWGSAVLRPCQAMPRAAGVFYVNDRLKGLLFEELQAYCQRGEHGGFLPAVKQIANVAALPGIVKVPHPALPRTQLPSPTDHIWDIEQR